MSGLYRRLKVVSWKILVPIITVMVIGVAYLGIFVLGTVDGFPGNTYSDGWRMGQLTHYAMEGTFLNKTGEAQLMHGNNSSAGVVTRGDGKVIFSNPGELSSSRSIHDAYRPLVGEMVAIHYRQIKVLLTHFNGDTDYRIVEVVKLDPSLAEDSCGVITNTTSGSRGDGDTVGYLVKVSDKGNLFKSYEAIIQVGNASGTFMALSINDDSIAKCAQTYLRAGLPVKVHYSQSIVRDPLTSDTNKNIVGISRIGKSS